MNESLILLRVCRFAPSYEISRLIHPSALSDAQVEPPESNVFITETFRRRYEAPARRNLEGAIGKL